MNSIRNQVEAEEAVAKRAIKAVPRKNSAAAKEVAEEAVQEVLLQAKAVIAEVVTKSVKSTEAVPTALISKIKKTIPIQANIARSLQGLPMMILTDSKE